MNTFHGTLIAMAISAITMTTTVEAAPFLVSDPYPASGPQPDSFTVQVNAGAPTVVTPLTDASGNKSLKFDLGSVAIPVGSFSVTVTANSSLWGSSSPANFTGTKSVPGAPGNLRLQP